MGIKAIVCLINAIISYIVLIAQLHNTDCFTAGDKIWSRSCSVRRRSSSRPMLVIGDNTATAAGCERGKKKRYSAGDGDSTRRSASSSSSGGEKKHSASGDNDDTDSDHQQNISVQGTRHSSLCPYSRHSQGIPAIDHTPPNPLFPWLYRLLYFLNKYTKSI